jgi:hypothetical protein
VVELWAVVDLAATTNMAAVATIGGAVVVVVQQVAVWAAAPATNAASQVHWTGGFCWDRGCVVGVLNRASMQPAACMVDRPSCCVQR